MYSVQPCGTSFGSSYQRKVLVFPSALSIIYPDQPGGIDVLQRIIDGVGIAVPTLWLSGNTTRQQCINTSEPSLCASVVSCTKVVKPRFNVPFFEGELLAGTVACV